MKMIYSARDSMDAEFVKGILDEQGIEAVIQGAALSNVLGSMATNLDATPQIWVREEDEERAIVAVSGFKSGAPAGCGCPGESVEMSAVRRADRRAVHRVLELRREPADTT